MAVPWKERWGTAEAENNGNLLVIKADFEGSRDGRLLERA